LLVLERCGVALWYWGLLRTCECCRLFFFSALYKKENILSMNL